MSEFYSASLCVFRGGSPVCYYAGPSFDEFTFIFEPEYHQTFQSVENKRNIRYWKTNFKFRPNSKFMLLFLPDVIPFVLFLRRPPTPPSAHLHFCHFRNREMTNRELLLKVVPEGKNWNVAKAPRKAHETIQIKENYNLGKELEFRKNGQFSLWLVCCNGPDQMDLPPWGGDSPHPDTLTIPVRENNRWGSQRCAQFLPESYRDFGVSAESRAIRGGFSKARF